MDVKIENEDICLNSSGNTVMIDEKDELLQRIKFCLTVEKGSFVYNKELGANLNLSNLNTKRGLKNIEAQLNEAVMGIDGVSIVLESVENGRNGHTLKLYVSYGGGDFRTEVIV